MADEGEVDVVLTDDASAEAGKDKPKEPVAAKVDKSLEEQLEQMKRERDAALQRAGSAEQEARDAGGRVAQSEEQVRQSHITTMTGALEILKQQKDQLTSELAAAMAEGNFQRGAEISAEMGTNAAKMLEIERGKIMAETAPVRQTRMRDIRSGDPAVEAVASTVTPKSADWFRAHPEYAKDPRLLNKVKAAHYKVISDLGEEQAESAAYFTAVEAELGIGREQIKPNGDAASGNGVDVTLSDASKPTQRRGAERDVQPPPAAPSRGGANARTVRLTPAQQEAAKISGLSNEDYARNLVAEKTRNTTH